MINGGVGHGTITAALAAKPTAVAKYPIVPVTNGVIINGIAKIGLSMIGIPKITGSLILKILGPIDNFIELTINPGEISGVDSITRTRNYTFTAPVGVTEWRVVGNEEANIKIISFSDTEATIRADYTILGPFVLEAHYSDGSIIIKNLRLVSLF